MFSVAALSQKGGVGKSTLARLIARTYAANDWRVKIADFNVRQKTSTDWAAMRLANEIEPSVPAECFTSAKEALKQDYDLIVFDGKPDSDISSLDIARATNLVLIPTGVSLDDLAPQVRFAHELIKKGIPKEKLLFAVNKTTESEISLKDAHDYIRQAGYACADTDLPVKTGYQIAQNTGRAISETTFPTLNERAENLAAEIVDRLHVLVGGD